MACANCGILECFQEMSINFPHISPDRNMPWILCASFVVSKDEKEESTGKLNLSAKICIVDKEKVSVRASLSKIGCLVSEEDSNLMLKVDSGEAEFLASASLNNE